LLFYCNPTILY